MFRPTLLATALAIFSCSAPPPGQSADGGGGNPATGCPDGSGDATPPAPIAAHTSDAARGLQHEWLVQAFLAGTYLGKPGDWTGTTVSARTPLTSQALARAFPGCGLTSTVTSSGVATVSLKTNRACSTAGHVFDGTISVTIAEEGSSLRTRASLAGTLDGVSVDVSSGHSGFTTTGYGFQTYGRTGTDRRATSGDVAWTAATGAMSITVEGVLHLATRTGTSAGIECTGASIVLDGSVASQSPARCTIDSAQFAWSDVWRCSRDDVTTAAALHHAAVWDGSGDPAIESHAVHLGADVAFTVPAPAVTCAD